MDYFQTAPAEPNKQQEQLQEQQGEQEQEDSRMEEAVVIGNNTHSLKLQQQNSLNAINVPPALHQGLATSTPISMTDSDSSNNDLDPSAVSKMATVTGRGVGGENNGKEIESAAHSSREALVTRQQSSSGYSPSSSLRSNSNPFFTAEAEAVAYPGGGGAGAGADAGPAPSSTTSSVEGSMHKRQISASHNNTLTKSSNTPGSMHHDVQMQDVTSSPPAATAGQAKVRVQEQQRPVMKPSFSSSSSTLSNKTITHNTSPAHQRQYSSSSSSPSSRQSPSSTSPRNQQQQQGGSSQSHKVNKVKSSTSPVSSPPASSTDAKKQSFFQNPTNNTSSTRSATLPLPPTLTLPGGKTKTSGAVAGAGGAGGALAGGNAAGGCGMFKLPSGACSGSATLPVAGAGTAAKSGITGFKAGLSRAFCGSLSRKGAEVVQNPRFKAISQPNEIKDILFSSSSSTSSANSNSHHNNTTLVLDLRPHTAYVSQGRFTGSINICVPSTLLRRPNFALSKIAETITSKKSREFFESIIDITGTGTQQGPGQEIGKGKGNKVFVLDQDTVLLSAETTVHSIMNKIEKSGFDGDIYWLRGGWNVLCNNNNMQQPQQLDTLNEIIDWEPFNEQEEDEEEENDPESDIEMESADSASAVTDEMSSSQMSDMQDSKTPRQLFPNGDGTGQGTNSGAYFASRLQDPHSNAITGRSSQSSFTSTTSSDSLFPSSIASSQSSVGSGGDFGSKDRATSTSPVTNTFDSSKLSLPNRRSASPATTMSSSSDVGVPSTKSRAAPHHLNLSASGSGKARSSSTGGCSIVMPRNLPMAAFQYNSTAQGAGAGAGTSESPQKMMHGRHHAGAAASGGDSVGGGGLYASRSALTSGSGSTRVAPFSRKTAANPFFDNIRQNLETQSLDRVLEHVAPFEIPSEFTKPEFVKLLPQYLQDVIAMSPKKRAEKLHKEYFDIEQAEQKRLQKVLDWHCQQSQVLDTTKMSGKSTATSSDPRSHSERSGIDSSVAEPVKASSENPEGDAESGQIHPFSISAGVEKGHLNRYKNMWPYEHARVRLENVSSPTCGDYINASHIRLRGTSKRYIASQGPLEQTTEHFWRLVLQEKVHVIVMLTLLQEGGRDKCSNYFQTAEYNDICVTLKEERGSIDAMKKSVCKDFGFFAMDEASPLTDSPPAQTTPAATGDRTIPLYASTPSQASQSVSMQHHRTQTPSGRSRFHGHKRSTSSRLDSAIVRRTIELRGKSDPPGTEPHVVRHIQYIKWPDFDIPPDPNILVDLISETNRAQRDLVELAQEEPPVLVHCSAGVGRTGTFIAVDTLLERYRQERRAQREGKSSDMPFKTRSRRTGSDVGSHMNSLVLTEQTPSSPKSPKTPKDKSHTDAVRPSPHRSHSSAEESPRHLAARLGIKELLPEDHSNPISAVVNQMREQRMSSVANAGQYIFTYVGLLAGIAHDLADEGALEAS